MQNTQLPITPGYGVQVATCLVAGNHVQRVVAGKEVLSITTVPVANARSYVGGAAIGGEQQFASALRSPDASSIVEGLVLVLTGGTAFNATLVLYSNPLQTSTPDSTSPLFLPADLSNLIGAISIASTDFIPISATHFIVNKAVTLQIPNNTSLAVYGVLFPTSNVNFSVSNPLQITLKVARS